MTQTRTERLNKQQWRLRKPWAPSFARIAGLLVGMGLLAIGAAPFFSFPMVSFWLLPLAAIYLAVLLMLPRLWLVVLPVATVVLDLTPWTGRFIYNEFDLIFLVTLASGFMYRRYRFKVYLPSFSVLLLLLYLAVVAIGFAGWSALVAPPKSSFANPYYSGDYAYKVAKGMLWGLALVPMWGHLLAVDKQKTVDWLLIGMCFAAIILGLVVLWERGTLGLILTWPAWYHIVSSLLELSASYRVTAFFADMHTGGETLDGVILLLMPGTLYATVWGKSWYLRLLGALAFLTLAYVMLVGFTRTTYVCFAFGVIVYAGFSLRLRRRAGLPSPVPIRQLLVTLVVALITAFVAQRNAGSVGLACVGAVLLLAFIFKFSKLPERYGWFNYVALGLVVLNALGANYSSRWAEPSLAGAVLMGTTLVALFLAASRLFASAGYMTLFNRTLLLGTCVLLPAGAAIALSGYQINERMTRVTSDLDTRGSHWADVTASADGGFLSAAIGNGVGSFPWRFIATHPQQVEMVGSFDVMSEGRNKLLRLGGGRDLQLGQRLSVRSNTEYTVDLRFRAERSGSLEIGLCERNLLYASNFMPPCIVNRISFEHQDGKFQDASVVIDSGRIGNRERFARWPTLFILRYGHVGQLVEIDSVQLSTNGFNLLRNSSFSDGLDNWFFYNDFSHLPWHVKNLFLQAWFETGWLGLLLLLSLIGLLVREGLRPRSADSLTPVYVTAVLTIAVFGLFGSPLDSARVSWLFYFFLAAGLAQLRVAHRLGRDGRSRVHHPSTTPSTD